MKGPAVLIVFLCLILSTLAFSAEQERIAKIEVTGNERIDKGIIANAIKSKEKETYDQTKIREDIKNVYKTGFFSDVQVDVKETDAGKTVTFIVIERPPVNVIYISGNKKIKTDDIKDKLKIKQGTVLNTERLRESVDEIIKLYGGKGYYATKVNYQIDYEEGYRATVRFVIEEAQRAYVRKITFKGNDHFKESVLKGAMRTREKGIFSWFTGSGILDEEALSDDGKLIEAYYYDHGYVRAKAGMPNISLSKDGKSISIALAVDEGKIYKISDIAFKGDIIFPEDDLAKKLKSKKGNTFRASLFQEDMLMLTDMYQDEGFAFADVAPLTAIDDDALTVAVTYEIEKGSEVYFNRINIIGNTKTRDKVIRRELRVAEGDRYSSTKLKMSKRRLRNTTYFKDTDLKTVKTDDPDKVNLDVSVQEKPTGTLSVGVGYSTYEKVLLTGTISQENILGTGKKVYLTASISSIARNFDLSLVDPYFRDMNLSAALGLFNIERYFTTYNYKSTGGTVTFLRPLTEYIKAGIRYKYERISVYHIDDSASSVVKDQQGTHDTSSVTLSLSKNSIDDVLNPSRGVISSISTEVAGGPFLGYNQFVKYVGTYGRYIPSYYDTTFFLRATAGSVQPYGGKLIPIYEKFFVGGINTIRGFRYGEAGPKDPITDDVIGGKNEMIFNAEWIFPIYKPAGLKGVVFFDAGQGFDDPDGWRFKNMRFASGFGIRWFSPMGPIRLELGFNLHPKEGEKPYVFDFMIGRAF